MIRRTFLGTMAVGVGSLLSDVPVLEKIVPLKSEPKDKPKILIQFKDIPFNLPSLEELKKTFDGHEVLILSGAEATLVDHRQTYFNWNTQSLPHAKLFSEKEEIGVGERVTWVETVSGLVGILNDNFQIEVFQYPPGLRVEFK